MNLNFSAVYGGHGKPAKWLRNLGKKSGVYVIRSTALFSPGVLYVGESHTGHLRKTLLRHFQKWDGPTQGNQFDRNKVEVAVIRCAPSEAVELQNKLIRELLPELNVYGTKPGESEPGEKPF